MDRLILFAIGILTQLSEVDPSTVHQVHNLILYPNKHEWCEAKDIEMVITHPGCSPKVFSNRVCVGQCFSYTSPRTKPPNRVEDKLKYCDYCAPTNTTWQKIVLECDTDRYTSVEKEVELIHQCSCDSCHPEQNTPAEQSQDNYLYEYDGDSAYDDYESPAQNSNIGQVAQERLRSQHIQKVDQLDRIEFVVNPETLDRASRVVAQEQVQQQGAHHHRSQSRVVAEQPVQHHHRNPSRVVAKEQVQRQGQHHHRAASRVVAEQPVQQQGHHHRRRYNNHDPNSRQWILNSDVEIQN